MAEKRNIFTVVETDQFSLTIVDQAKFDAAFQHWKKKIAVQKNPTKQQFLKMLALKHHKGEGIAEAGVRAYTLDFKRTVSFSEKVM